MDAARPLQLDLHMLKANTLGVVVLIGSAAEIVDKLVGLRERLGISHYVVRDADGFAPIVDELRGR